MKLEPTHDRAIDLLVSGHRQYEIAAELKISDRTLRRWIKNPDFREELETQRDGARTMAQTVMAIAAADQAAYAHNAINLAYDMLNSHDPKTHERAIVLGMKLIAQQERQASNEKWREFVYFDKLKRKEAEAAKKAQSESEAVPSVPSVPPVPQDPATAESGQDRTKADTTGEATPENGQNRTNPDTAEPLIVIKEAKFTSASTKPNVKVPNKAPFYAGVAGRR